MYFNGSYPQISNFELAEAPTTFFSTASNLPLGNGAKQSFQSEPHLIILPLRKDTDGRLFLPQAMADAARRLREDFELKRKA